MAVQPVIQSATAPIRGACLALTLDATAREYDLNAILMGGFDPSVAARIESHVLFRMQSIGAITYFYFGVNHDAAPHLNEATVVAAGGSLVYDAEATAAMCFSIPSGATLDVWLDRRFDRYMTVKGSGAGTLRMYAASLSQ